MILCFSSLSFATLALRQCFVVVLRHRFASFRPGLVLFESSFLVGVFVSSVVTLLFVVQGNLSSPSTFLSRNKLSTKSMFAIFTLSQAGSCGFLS